MKQEEVQNACVYLPGQPWLSIVLSLCGTSAVVGTAFSACFRSSVLAMDLDCTHLQRHQHEPAHKQRPHFFEQPTIFRTRVRKSAGGVC